MLTKITVAVALLIALCAATEPAIADAMATQAESASTVVEETVCAPEVNVVEETIPEVTEPPFITSDPSITWKYDYVQSHDGIMPYGLYTPSTANTNEETPLIVWLHGNGERNTSDSQLSRSGLLDVMNKWTLDGFNAYVVTPHLSYGFDTGLWMKPKAVEYLSAVLDELTSLYNIDTDRIILCGHSLGGQGSTFIASNMPGTFSCVAVLSGYNCYMDLPIDVPVCGYVGASAYGEDSTSYNYMVGKFTEEYPDAEVTVFNTTHCGVVVKAFTQDLNQDNKSDLVEWMLAQ